MLGKKILKLLEEEDIELHSKSKRDDGTYYREIEFYSNEGEDVIELVEYDGTCKGFINGFIQMANDFDVDEHAEMWIECRNRVSGVPNSIRALIDDADWIKEKLDYVACNLNIMK